MPEVTFVHLLYTCYVCQTVSFKDKTRLRNHLWQKEEIYISPPKPGKRTIDKNIVYVDSCELKRRSEQGVQVIKKYACPSCNSNFEDLNNLQNHVEMEHTACTEESSSIMTNAPAMPMMVPPLSKIDTDMAVAVKKGRTETEAITRAYELYSDNTNDNNVAGNTSKIIKSVINGINLKPYTMFPDTKDECYAFTTDVQLPQIMSSCGEKGVEVIPCTSPRDLIRGSESRDGPSYLEVDDCHLKFLIATEKINTVPLLSDEYNEVAEMELELLNEDWNFGFHLRAVCAQLLAGSLLVEKDEVLLINCIEVYSRFNHLDIHSERFNSSSNYSSNPTGAELYDGIKICNPDLDNSHKLVIGTYTFTGLVTSSLRLDKKNLEPELGPSTYNFAPTKNTKLFIAASSIKKANVLLSKKSVQINNYDKYSQIRQLRSNFIVPNTYQFSRSSSRFTDNLYMKPSTIFTAFCAEEGDEFTDLKFGSNIMRFIAAAILNEKKSFSCKELNRIGPSTKKETFVHKRFQNILDLGSDEDSVPIIGNIALERLLYEIAERITPRLKELNVKVIKRIAQSSR